MPPGKTPEVRHPPRCLPTEIGSVTNQLPRSGLARLVHRESGLPRADWIAQGLLAAAPQMP
jgi:hypothetical protein